MENASITAHKATQSLTQALSIKDTLKLAPEDQTVCVKGWIRSKRDSKAGFSFLVISDGSCFATIQAVVPEGIENYSSEILKLTKDCAVSVTGTLVASQGKEQNVEIAATHVHVHGWVEDPETYPISPKRHTMEHLRDYQHLRVRTNIIGAVSRVRHSVSYAIHTFFNQNQFFWLNSPIITASDCEGAGELFRVSTLDTLHQSQQKQSSYADDFFGEASFLTVSGQLNAESYALGLSKVYTFGPTFRAENSNTSRHLAEFWMVEPEVAFSDLAQNAQLAQDLLQFVVKHVLDNCSEDITFFNKWVDKTVLSRLESIVKSDFERISYSDAISLLEKSTVSFDYPVSWGIDLQSEHERYICEQVVKGPTIITDYPKDIKAFYMRLNSDEKTVAAMDVLAPGIGEIIGGSQREERLDVLDTRMDACKVDKKAYQWYRDLRRYGTAPHSGFGLGFERLVGYITGVANIRDIHPFPRTPGSIGY